MRIAVIGSGISGMAAAHRLRQRHDVTVYESESRYGGHTQTVEVEIEGQSYCVDVGFIVYNVRTYPRFIELLEELDVSTKPTGMSFGISCERTGLEWASRGPRSVFAQPRNLLDRSFLRMLRDALRFNRESRKLLDSEQEKVSLGDYLVGAGFSQGFIDHYIVPLGAAIWSSNPAHFLEFPATTFVRFFENHGLLSASPSVPWRVIEGGSQRYAEKLVSGFGNALKLGCPVRQIRRHVDHVEVIAQDGRREFDQVVIATHSDQALGLLADPSAAERQILGAIGYQANDVVLHSDVSMMPARRRAWASWNYRIPQEPQARALLTYDMNRLQGIHSKQPLLVTLNSEGRINPSKVHGRFELAHPVFNQNAVEAQRLHHTINGRRRTFYVGAYWGYGFHEDGVRSALVACDAIEKVRH